MKFEKQFEDLASYFYKGDVSDEETKFFNQQLLKHLGGEKVFDDLIQWGEDQGIDADKQIEMLIRIIEKNESKD